MKNEGHEGSIIRNEPRLTTSYDDNQLQNQQFIVENQSGNILVEEIKMYSIEGEDNVKEESIEHVIIEAPFSEENGNSIMCQILEEGDAHTVVVPNTPEDQMNSITIYETDLASVSELGAVEIIQEDKE